MFKNLIVYRLIPEWDPTLSAAQEAAFKQRFTPCGKSQPQSMGWVPPRGEAEAPLIEVVGGHWLMRLQVEQKLLPGSVVKRRADEMAQQVEASTGRKPGKRESKELREQATQELLPQAFTKMAGVSVWIAPKQKFVCVDAGSTSRAEVVITMLVKTLEGFGVQALQTALSPASAMAGWLESGEAPPFFTVDRDCELKAVDEMKSAVRYARHALDGEEVRQHIRLGKRPTRLALTWHGRVSFVLTEQLQVKKIQFEDGVFEGAGATKAEDGFDADAAIATGELIQLLPDLIEALGGEQALGAVPGVLPSAPAAAPAAPAAAAAPARTNSPLPATAEDDNSPPW
ncbi:recombination-associated protein RdgC [Ideonella paludis]|uniref:Recombination-associated protein RdgC n=1 Tax=Ideonella paludis TaxID=1233411 RepID=A0ABS5DZV2_9BURK|nr:recombination-associated protein RdgC [Ideonella paludis]MBQ0936685.1 recombination-associated protein RdgC [Ideonella paludis]